MLHVFQTQGNIKPDEIKAKRRNLTQVLYRVWNILQILYSSPNINLSLKNIRKVNDSYLLTYIGPCWVASYEYIVQNFSMLVAFEEHMKCVVEQLNWIQLICASHYPLVVLHLFCSCRLCNQQNTSITTGVWYLEQNIKTTCKPKFKFNKAMIICTDISKVKTEEIKLVRNVCIYTKIWTKLKMNILTKIQTYNLLNKQKERRDNWGFRSDDILFR
jgi:hypothetical protein